jgi:hypothetical protein
VRLLQVGSSGGPVAGKIWEVPVVVNSLPSWLSSMSSVIVWVPANVLAGTLMRKKVKEAAVCRSPRRCQAPSPGNSLCCGAGGPTLGVPAIS